MAVSLYCEESDSDVELQLGLEEEHSTIGGSDELFSGNDTVTSEPAVY